MTTINTLHSLFLNCSGVSTDTRKIDQDCLFFALKGENFDANTFAKEAIEKGAKYVVIDNPEFQIENKTLLVENSLVALQELAKFHRNHLGLPIIALTGSNGKTTTKELIHAVLLKKFKTLATIGNLNNHIGVPLTLLRFTKETEIGIVEMGANHQKEIEFLCQIAQPDYGYITNFGKAHLEGFGGVEGVIKGKSEMYDYLRTNNKLAFVNLDDSIQKEKTKDIKQYSFGLNSNDSNVIITNIEANPMVKITFNEITIHSHLIGIYNANNINAAITIGKFFEVSDELIKEAIEHYIPENNRSQLIQKNTNEIILDAYNANPSSMAAAIENFKQLDKENKIAILGDMFELGEESLAEHKKIVELLENNSNITTYFIGKDFYSNRIKSNHLHFFEDFNSFSKFIEVNKPTNSLLIIKGSRGMALERILESI
ncbi:UDP-N-acetylmuramoyl-tripeptide--D-alanyl-D-alanine ligase [Flavobacterium channae]|uniref:UDP-N-acetylmuramoyl-tripeptide--D-alanyl-D- alanine ligase n=1 Tax=Flavobacterium channae TaxID=2897181 RepID=UPI001E30CAE1|nr:UDP-N-acetylmuramoyl-tripeptide--D-alanyl-D-alanine ligase [Flavobacterium channae]UGS24063.1 UDP-N-acetylmuramoyl-tripeptide--D-alanyl-D-alanine ligase [Flavobacterium channae]